MNIIVALILGIACICAIVGTIVVTLDPTMRGGEGFGVGLLAAWCVTAFTKFSIDNY
jgi:hypothetical protein